MLIVHTWLNIGKSGNKWNHKFGQGLTGIYWKRRIKIPNGEEAVGNKICFWPLQPQEELSALELLVISRMSPYHSWGQGAYNQVPGSISMEDMGWILKTTQTVALKQTDGPHSYLYNHKWPPGMVWWYPLGTTNITITSGSDIDWWKYVLDGWVAWQWHDHQEKMWKVG